MKRFPFLRTVSARLTLLNVLVLALVLLTLGGILRAAVTLNLMKSIDSDLARRTVHHKDFWAMVPGASHAKPPVPPPGPRWPGEPPGGPRRGAQTAMNRLRETSAAFSSEGSGTASQWRTPVIERVFDLNGKQSWPHWGGEDPWDRVAFAHAAGGQETYSTVFDGEERVRVLSAPLRRMSGQMAGVVQVGSSLADVDRSLSNLNKTLFTLAPVALLAAGLGGLILTRWMHRPLRQVNQAVALISAEDLSRRLVVSGQDEFSNLAANFNAMLNRLEQAFEQQRRFTADASHELRTPLTVIKVYSSRALCDPDISDKQRHAWRATDRAATLMNAIVQDLLLLARSDAGQLTFELRPTSLWESVEAAIETVRMEGGASITNSIPNHLMVSGDAVLLTRVFTNLLKNALCHTPAEGLISITAEVKSDVIVAVVADTGTGIPPEHLPHVLERFYRVDEARARAGGGTGLGLAICQNIVQAHGGHIAIESQPGQGARVTVTLPLNAPA
jgi:two-component system OmpR family sensor kinase